MKKNFVEKISQRCEYFANYELCGFCAETKFKENGKEYFLVIACVSDDYMPESHISVGKSCFDYYTMASDDEDFEEIENYEGNAPLDDYSDEMCKMIVEKMKEEDFDEEVIEGFLDEIGVSKEN